MTGLSFEKELLSLPGAPLGADSRKYVVGLLVSASTLIALYVNLFLGIDTVYTHFFYVPVALAALWYYWKAAYVALFLGVLHVSMGAIETGAIVPGTVIRAAALLAVAVIIASLSEARLKLHDLQRRSSEEDLRRIFNSVDEAIFIHGLDGKLIDANDCVTQLYGVPREEAVRLSLADYYTGQNCPENRFARAWEKALEGEEQLFEWLARRPVDGSTFPAEVCLRKIRLREQEVIIARARDISSRKLAEEELSDARRRAELYMDLMGHDITNLNQVGIGYLEIALETLSCDAEGRYLLQRPLESMQSSSRLIDNVRKLQKIQTEKRRAENLDLGDLLAQVKAEFADASGRDLRLEYEPVNGCRISGNPLLKEAFRNLVGNAVRHSEGQLSIRLALEEKAEGDRSYYRVSIEDDGPGIRPEIKPQLFTRIVRGSARTGGHGLGLLVVKALVEDSGGRVWVEDRIPGDYTKGSRFVVVLPASAATIRRIEN